MVTKKIKTILVLLKEKRFLRSILNKLILIQFNKAIENNKEYIPIRYNRVKILLYTDSKLSKILLKNTFEYDEQKFIGSVLKKNDVFFDIGANFGLFSLIAAKKVGVNGKVYSFEPTPNVFKRLKENIEINKFSNIYPFQIGISDSNSMLDFYVNKNGHDAWNSFCNISNDNIYNKIDRIKVQTTYIDDFIQVNNIKKINLIKIDVEGFEMKVLLGGKQYFRQKESAPILIEFTDINLNQAGTSAQELYYKLVEYGYVLFSLNNSKLKQEKLRSTYPYINLIAIKPNHRLFPHNI